ncbi:MAG: pilus assembly protein [Anaerolineae bacterium]|nr:pilus assembly protein [Anaerolineae bacterium]
MFKLRKRAHGQSLVEFAFMFPIFLGVLIGLMSLAILFYSYVTLHLAVREGAGVIVRCPSLNCDTPRLNNGNPIRTIEDVRTYIREKSFSLNVGQMNILIEPTSQSQWVVGVQVSVSASYSVPLPEVAIPMQNSTLRLGRIQIQAQSVMTIE